MEVEKCEEVLDVDHEKSTKYREYQAGTRWYKFFTQLLKLLG